MALPAAGLPRAPHRWGTVDDLLRGLAPTAAKPCDEPAYLIPGLPLSVAQMNLIYAAGLAILIWRGAARRMR